MTPSIGVTDIMSSTPEKDSTPRAPTDTPVSAIRMGRPAATRVPSMTSSTIPAMTTPITSAGPTSWEMSWAISRE
jgi:hypothetical protein